MPINYICRWREQYLPRLSSGKQKVVVLVAVLFVAFLAFFSGLIASSYDSDPLSRLLSGNDDGWHLVTVRYRDDSGEMRFIYANNKAWEAFQKGKTPYPDGSVFGKSTFTTSHDPDFTSSLIPSGLTRYQFMVKNSKKYPETDGWDYTLTFPDGAKPGPDIDPENTLSESCHACHKIVPDRDYVFATPFAFDPMSFNSFISAQNKLDTSEISKISPHSLIFATKDIKYTPYLLRSLVKSKRIRLVQGELTEKLFSGTLNEIIPSLIREVQITGLPAALTKNDGSAFTLVQARDQKTGCRTPSGEKGKPFIVHMRFFPLFTPSSNHNKGAPGGPLRVHEACILPLNTKN